jgi:allophanate hydrolase subunit 2
MMRLDKPRHEQIAAAGPGFALLVNNRQFRMWTSVYVRENGQIQFEKRELSATPFLKL